MPALGRERVAAWSGALGIGLRTVLREPALSLALIDRVDPDSRRAKAAFVLLRKPGAP